MEAEGNFETLTSLYQITSPHITEDTAYERGTVSVTKKIIKIVSSHTNQLAQKKTPSSALKSAKSKFGNLRQAAGDTLFKSQISYF